MLAPAPSPPRPTRHGRVPHRSPLLIRLFRTYARRYVARHVHAVRLAADGRPARPADGPTVVVLNHPSWWDPLTCIVLSDLFPGAEHYAAIAAPALARYRFFGRLGFFGVDPHTVRGGRDFLRTAGAILARPRAVLWITAQGEFTDPRQRPAGLKDGVAHLVRRLGRGAVLPLALEYPFWQERTPEVLARFGPPLAAGPGDVRTWTDRIERALEQAQDQLAARACRRDPHDFETLLTGGAGVGGIYDRWRRLSAWLRGQRFQAGHGTDHRP